MVESRFPERAAEILRLAEADSGDMDRVRANCVMNGQRFGLELLARRAADSGLPAYFYEFASDMPGDDNGAFHSAELWFVFETLGISWRPFVGRHYDLARQICSYWTNFAKTGDPNGLDRNGEPLPVWEPYDVSHPRTMGFRAVPAMDGETLPAVRAMIACAADQLWKK